MPQITLIRKLQKNLENMCISWLKHDYFKSTMEIFFNELMICGMDNYSLNRFSDST